MKIQDIEDGAQILTKDYLRAELAELKAEILGRLLDLQGSLHRLIFGTYALIVLGVFLGVFVNHFWK